MILHGLDLATLGLAESLPDAPGEVDGRVRDSTRADWGHRWFVFDSGVRLGLKSLKKEDSNESRNSPQERGKSFCHIDTDWW
jgi:hypothetical protein